ncbi:hypothetical protein DWG88_07880 [Escherichia coli]|nr:hypothetical protein [Escherichia coli]
MSHPPTVPKMSDATLARLIRPTGSTCVGRIRRLRRIRQWCSNATRFIRSGLLPPASEPQQ